MGAEMIKMCSTCQYEKPVSQFGRKTERRDGLTSQCKACTRSSHRKWRLSNIDLARENSRRWQRNNSFTANQKSREWQKIGRRRSSETFAKSAIVRKKSQCKATGTAFDLTWEWYVDGLNFGCAITGVPFDLSLRADGERFKRHNPAIDRIDPAAGYLKSNCRLVTAAVNVARHCWGDDGLRALHRELRNAFTN